MPETADTGEVQKSAALEAVEVAEKMANARKLEAEADKATIEAGKTAFPDSSSKGPEGKVEVGEGVGLVADLVAHSMLEDAADRVMADIGEALHAESSKVLLVDSPDLVGSDWPYLAISRQVENERRALTAAKQALVDAGEGHVSPQAQAEGILSLGVAGAVMSAIPGIVGTVADVASLFRADYSIKAREVKIGTPALDAVLAKRLLGKSRKLNLDKFSLLTESSLFTDFGETGALRLEVQRLATELKERRLVPADRKVAQADTARKAYEAALQAKEGDKPAPTSLEALKGRMEALDQAIEKDDASIVPARAAVSLATQAIEHFDAFATAVSKAPETGYPPLVAAAVREALHEGGYTHVLYAGVEAAAGETITRRTLVKTRVRFLGGSQVSYLLWEVKDSRLVAANSFPVLGEVELGMKSGIEGTVKKIGL